MTSHAGRFYALAAAVVAFFLAWAVVAAHPWSTVKAAPDPRLAALAAREHRLRAAQRTQQPVAAAAPAPRVVTLPPLVITRTS